MTDHLTDTDLDDLLEDADHVGLTRVAALVAGYREHRATLVRVRAFVQHWHEDPGATLVERSATGRVLALLDGAR